jgi:6,7-dimethyl-8-ribityllumazine synthase
MIRSVHKLLVARNEKDYRALAAFFDALGLPRGESWEGRRSKGVKFDAREAGVEIGTGQGFPDADLVIETDHADVLYELARKKKLKIVDEIADADWGARLFTLELPNRMGRLAVFSYKQDWRPAPRKLTGELNASGRRFGIVVARFNAFITERLLDGALDALRRCGAADKDIEVARVPGSFEIPSAARAMAEGGCFDAILCLGCLIRGDTAHYEVIANECARGIGQSAQETGIPHAFGVLTTENLEQAIDRAGVKAGNKGFEAALAAVEMASLKKAISHQPSAISKGASKLVKTARSAKTRKKR